MDFPTQLLLAGAYAIGYLRTLTGDPAGEHLPSRDDRQTVIAHGLEFVKLNVDALDRLLFEEAWAHAYEAGTGVAMAHLGERSRLN